MYRKLFLTVLPLMAALILSVACTPTQPEASSSSPPAATAADPEEAAFAEQRERMVIETIQARGISDERVLEAMRTVPRHLFVPEEQRGHAYGDYPLPIGFGQTISQPYIVALMTELLELQPGDRVLEIGTGSGYQAAILASIPDLEVYSVEIVPELAQRAQQLLQDLEYQVNAIQGDGYYGYRKNTLPEDYKEFPVESISNHTASTTYYTQCQKANCQQYSYAANAQADNGSEDRKKGRDASSAYGLG